MFIRRKRRHSKSRNYTYFLTFFLDKRISLPLRVHDLEKETSSSRCKAKVFFHGKNLQDVYQSGPKKKKFTARPRHHRRLPHDHFQLPHDHPQLLPSEFPLLFLIPYSHYSGNKTLPFITLSRSQRLLRIFLQ